jgi:autoinducer 2-degrading protein
MTKRQHPYVITVAFDVETAERARFLDLVCRNAAASLDSEPGCLRFDVLVPQGDGEPDVLLYEIYEDREAFQAHLDSEHFRDFDTTTRAAVRRKTVQEYELLPSPRAEI